MNSQLDFTRFPLFKSRSVNNSHPPSVMHNRFRILEDLDDAMTNSYNSPSYAEVAREVKLRVINKLHERTRRTLTQIKLFILSIIIYDSI